MDPGLRVTLLLSRILTRVRCRTASTRPFSGAARVNKGKHKLTVAQVKSNKWIDFDFNIMVPLCSQVNAETKYICGSVAESHI